jgi:hypothetical protein
MKRVLLFLIVFLGLLGVSSPAMADWSTFQNGYYYITAMNGSEERAAYMNNTKLSWDPIERGNPSFMFYLEKTNTKDQYYMQSLSEGSWFGDVLAYYVTGFYPTKEQRLATIFAPNSDGETYKWRPAKMRPDHSDAEQYSQYGNFGFDGQTARDANGDGTPDAYHALSQWGGADWKLEAVPESELNSAKMSLSLRKAFDVYNSAQLYTVSTDPLITNVDETADPATGEPSQFFAICQRTDDANSSFANLIDGNADDNHFQSTWTTETGVTKYDQWLQVDVSADGTDKQVAGFQLKLGLRSNAWGSAQQPTDITLYATNDETIAKDADISAIQTVANTDGWVKIGDFNLPYDKALKYVNGNWGDQYLATINGDEAKNRWLTKDIVLMGNKYRFLRFYMNEMAVNNSDNHQFTFSQFQLYEIPDPAVSDAQKDKVDALKSLIEDGQAKVKAGTVTADDIAAVQAAIEAVQNSKSQALTSLENLLDSISSSSITLNPGVGPGQNDTAKVQAYNAALAAAQAAVHAAHTDAEYTQYGDELRSTLKAALELNPISDGYYNIVNSYTSFYEKKAMEARPGEKVMGWNTYDAKSTAQLFKITGLGDGTYSIQNVQTGQYFGTVAGQSQNPAMTDTQETGQTIKAIAGASTQFNIANTANDMAYHAQYHESGQNKRGLVCTWNGGSNSASAWTLIKVTDQALLDSLVAAAPLAQAKALAAQELENVESVKNAAKGYKKGKALITNADDTDADSNQFFTTCETSDDYSAYAHLIDGDMGTCFQSTWDASQSEAPQWLQVDLKDHPVKNFNIYWGLRNGYWGAREMATDITLYASNDDATAKDEQINTLDKLVATGKWTKICDFTFDQNVPMTTYSGSNRSVSKNINDKMDQTYRYLRFFFNETYRNSSPNWDYTIGEFQIYENTIDEASSPVGYVDGLQAAVDAMMTKAGAVEAAAAAGTLTMDDVKQLAELRKAAEALTPDASELESTYNTVKTYTDNFEAGTEIGDVNDTQWTDMQSALTAAKAVLDKEKPSRAEQDAQVTALNSAIATFKAAQIMPETGKWYFIVSRDKTRSGSIQVNGEGENEGVAHVNSIYSTFIYGNVAYATSDNSIDAAGGWGAGNKNALHWGYYEAGTGKGGSLGQGEYEGMADPHTMWCFAPIEGQEGAYSIQNRSNGLYVGNYNGTSWQTLSATPAPFKFELLGSGQVAIHKVGEGNWWTFAGDGYVYTYSNTTKPETEWSFALEPVPNDIEALSVYIPDNSIEIMSLPYAIPSDYVDLNADAGLVVYGIKGLQIVNGDSTLLLTKKTEIAAGEPFIVIANDYTSFDASNITTTPFSVPLPDEYVRESKSVNGLVSAPDYTTIKKEGLGYFTNSTLKATGSNTGIDAFTGYIDINSVPVFTTETQADATISLAGKGIDAIKGIVANGKAFNVYTIDGKLVKKNATSVKGLGKGIYIFGNRKVAVK